MNKAEITRQIHAQWDDICARAESKGVITLGVHLPQSLNILGASVKTEKGPSVGVLTAIAYLPPATEAGFNTCSHATKQCAAVCLGHSSGRLAMDTSANARRWKLILMIGGPDHFNALLICEVMALEAKAKRLGLIPAVRLDGSTDLGYARRMAKRFPNTRWYDYTKNVSRALAAAAGKFGDNYHVTFSFSGENEADCRRVLRAGGNVAVVFESKPYAGELPARWKGFPTLNGDATDVRFMDPPGYVVALSFKQSKNRAEGIKLAGNFCQRKGRGKRLPQAC